MNTIRKKLRTFFKSKAGVTTMNFIISAVIVFLSLFLVSSLAAKTLSKVSPKTSQLICEETAGFRTSTATTVGVKGNDVQNVKVFPLICKTGSPDLVGNEKDPGKPEDIMRELGNLMTKCYETFNYGKTPGIFQDLPGADGKNSGFVCYSVVIKELQEPISGKKFVKFLQTETHPEFGDNKNKKKDGETYLDFIQYAKGGAGIIITMLDSQTNNNGGLIRQGYRYEIAFIERGDESNDWIADTLLGGGAVTATAGVGAIVVGAVATGGIGIIIAGGALVVGGGLLAAEGGQIKYDQLFKQERDVSTILLIDTSNKPLVTKLHKEVLITDITGE